MDRRVVASRREAGPTSLVIFGALTGLAALTGAYFDPGQWYRQLITPSWAPATSVFPLVWSALYVAIALAGWRVWRKERRISVSLVLWFMQLALNAAWSWFFFGLHLPLLAFVDLLLLLLAVAAFALVSYRRDRIASLLFLPYAVWLVFAGAVNYAIWKLNLGLL